MKLNAWVVRDQDTRMLARSCGKVLQFHWLHDAVKQAAQWTNATAHLGGDWRASRLTEKERLALL